MRVDTLAPFILAFVGMGSTALAGDPWSCIHLSPGHTDFVTGVALSADGKYAVSGSADKTAIVWDATTGKKIRTLIAPAMVSSLAMSGDGKLIVAGLFDSSAILWEAATGRTLKTLNGHSKAVLGV